jgi:hypothetical protein
MPFPINIKYIKQLENNLNIKFPEKFKIKMMKDNGGEWSNEEYYFELYPFFDKTDSKRISRTCNHIGKETESARKWMNFPKNAIPIGSDGCGNQLVLIHNGDKNLSEELYFWNHETGEIEQIAENINEFKK